MYDEKGRPPHCRFRLKDEGKPYPRSSCMTCHATLLTLGLKCPYDKSPKEGSSTATAPTADVPTLSDALDALYDIVHAVCGETGFANCVRSHTGMAYPWPALDIAEAKARAILAAAKSPKEGSNNETAS